MIRFSLAITEKIEDFVQVMLTPLVNNIMYEQVYVVFHFIWIEDQSWTAGLATRLGVRIVG